MSASAPTLIPAGTVFTAEEITDWADRGRRTLEEALTEADLLVSAPHAGAAIPAELAPYLAPELTKRLQHDFTDCTTAAIVRRWAQIDPRVVAVINPHPRMVRDPNRAKPADVVATLREALDRVAAAGRWQRVDLSGVDAIRPVTFSFFPILDVPGDADGLTRLCEDFARVAEQGLGVYERTRDALLDRMLERASDNGGRVTTLSFHDTMNTTTTPEGAVVVARDPKDRLPAVVALSNRGDAEGESRGDDDRPTMAPARLRALAEAHRRGFEVAAADDVLLNQPYLGSQEIVAARARFADFHAAHPGSGVVTDAVQAEFLREFLLGERATAQIQRPGTDWPAAAPEQVDRVAQACKRAWADFRSGS
ncbi:N-formylglutamate amidohydrolase [Nocardioides sp. NPDC059952]|uniref:N-formylglutamate amidohydrolase n=1 Tax=Nocardioides sp. NPDC059952 TaxID=3347014 RepID=UPI00364951CD